MDLLLLFIGICLTIYFEDHPTKKERMRQMPHGCNIGIQYIYTIDEWYRLRCEFDERIERSWALYKEDLITEEDYKNDCMKVIEDIIGYDNIEEFQTLYQWGVRNAAIRTAKAGYNPGLSNCYGRTLEELNEWEPERYASRWEYWNRCVPGDANFLTMYPDKWELEYMYLGNIKHDQWSALPFKEFQGHQMFPGYFGEEARRTALDLLVERGYDGETYTKEAPRNFGDLTEEEIKKKYKYVVNGERSNYCFEEMSAHCESGVRKKYVYDR